MEKKYYHFGTMLKVYADTRLDNDTVHELWNGFTFRLGKLKLCEGERCCLTVGEPEKAAVPDGAEYIVKVGEKGIYVAGRDYASLARAMMVLMMRIEQDGQDGFRIECCELEGRYSIARRMIHFCVFPETSHLFLKKCIRLAGVMQYTHIVLEFWGMLKYDCMKELAWDNALTKDETSALVQSIEDMGMEAIPMFNHLGHASACRVSGGKHVVLDQNPSLAYLFAPDGWSWNIESKKAAELLTRIRQELYELFPHSEYFHLGCDEVYSYEKGDEDQQKMRNYLQDLTETVHNEGKRPIIWGDMLLNREALKLDKAYFCSCDTPENAQKLIAAIPKYTVIADWHYDITETPVKTSVFLKEQGFDVVGVPWFEYGNCIAHADTVRDYGLHGIMVSTWHTLSQKMPHIVFDALQFGAYQSPWSGQSGHKIETETAALLRKVCFVEGDYIESGWTRAQVFMHSRPMV